jgi:hypothetical protein
MTHREITLAAEAKLDALFADLCAGRIDGAQYDREHDAIGAWAIGQYDRLARKAQTA